VFFLQNQVLLVGDELIEHGEGGETMAEQAGHRHRRLGDRDHGDLERLLERIDPHPAEAGKNHRVRMVKLQRLQARPDHEGPREVVGEGAVDLAGPSLRGDADQLGSCRRTPSGRRHDGGRDGLGAVGVDHQELHGASPLDAVRGRAPRGRMPLRRREPAPLPRAEPRAGTPAVPMIAEHLRRRVPLRAPRLTRVSVGDARPPRGERNAGAGGAAGVVTPLRWGIISCALVDRGSHTPERGFRLEDTSMRSGPGVGRFEKRP
jgi:hypothetical protein